MLASLAKLLRAAGRDPEVREALRTFVTDLVDVGVASVSMEGADRSISPPAAATSDTRNPGTHVTAEPVRATEAARRAAERQTKL